MKTELELKWQQDIVDARLRKIAAKKERRVLRHKTQADARKLIQSHKQGLCCTTAQIKANAKLVTDRYLNA